MEKLTTFQVVSDSNNRPIINGTDKWNILGTKALIKDCALDTPDWDINRLFDHLYNNLCKLIVEQNRKGNWDIHNFRTLVNTIRTKWDSVNNKIPGNGITEQLWNAFYASRICMIGNILFPEVYSEVHSYEKKEKTSITVTKEVDTDSTKTKRWSGNLSWDDNPQNFPKPKGKVVGKLRIKGKK